MASITTIRGLNPSLLRNLKIEAVKEDLAIGQALNLAIEKWLREHSSHGKRKQKSFWDLKPISFTGKDAGELSKKVDEVLYG